MTTLDVGIAALRTAAGRLYEVYDRFGGLLKSVMPKGLYARALLIIIAPMVVLQSVVAYVFMERHWSRVTQRLSAGVVQDIATLIEVYKVYPQDAGETQIRRIAQDKLGLTVDFRRARSRSSRSSIRRSQKSSGSRSAGRSGSTRWDARRWSRSASSSTTTSCGCSRAAAPPTPRTPRSR